MSVSVMTLVYKAHFHDITFIHKGKKKATGEEYEKAIKVSNFNLKSVCLALADHANDEGEGAYPAVETISSKTEISDVTVIACLKAMKQEGIITYTGRSKWDTCNYTVNKAKLVEMAGWERQKRLSPKSKAALVPEVKPLNLKSEAALPEPSIHPKPSSGARAPFLKSMPIEWQLAAGVEEVVVPDNKEAARKDIATEIAKVFGVQAPTVYEMVMTFQNERDLTFTTDDVSGQRKAIRSMLAKNVKPEHVLRAVRKLMSINYTVVDLFAVVKNAIDFANENSGVFVGERSHAL